jgi:hypothetical protein
MSRHHLEAAVVSRQVPDPGDWHRGLLKKDLRCQDPKPLRNLVVSRTFRSFEDV